jgi:hypothetical protein
LHQGHWSCVHGNTAIMILQMPKLFTVIWGLMVLFCTHAYRSNVLQCSQKSKHIHYPRNYRTLLNSYDAAARIENRGCVRFQSFLKFLRKFILIGSYNVQPALKWESNMTWLWDILYSICLWLWVVFICSATWFTFLNSYVWNVIIGIEMNSP